jgi:hypothetical protein
MLNQFMVECVSMGWNTLCDIAGITAIPHVVAGFATI